MQLSKQNHKSSPQSKNHQIQKEFSGEVIWYVPDYLTPLIAVFGVLLATATMHIARWTGKVHGKFAKALLVSD